MPGVIDGSIPVVLTSICEDPLSKVKSCKDWVTSVLPGLRMPRMLNCIIVLGKLPMLETVIELSVEVPLQTSTGLAFVIPSHV